MTHISVKRLSFFGITLASAMLIAFFAWHQMSRASGVPAEADLWASGSNESTFTIDESTGNGVNFEWCGAGGNQHQCVNADDCSFYQGEATYTGDFPNGSFTMTPGTTVLVPSGAHNDYFMWWGGPVSPLKGRYSLYCGSNGVGVTSDVIFVNTRSVARAVADKVGDNNPTGQTLPTATVTVYKGYSVGLDGKASSDKDNDTITFRWSCSGGALSDSTSNAPSWNHDGKAAVGNYTCDLTVNDGSVSSNNAARVSIAVTPVPVVTADIKARGPNLINEDGPISVASGANVWLTWSSTNATSCTGTGFSTGGAAQNTSGVLVNPTTNTTYTVTCTGAFGPGDSNSVVVNIAGLPEADITADATSVVSGNSTTIRWCGGPSNHACANTFSNGCWVGGSPGGQDLQAPGTGSCLGNFPTEALSNTSRTYYLTTRGTGGESTDSVTVTWGAAAATAPTSAPGISVNQICSPQGMQIGLGSPAQGATSYDLDRCTNASCSSPTTIGTSIQFPQNDTGATVSGTTYYYRARGRNNVETGPNSSVISATFSAATCTAPASAFLQVKDRNGAVVVNGSNASPVPSGFTKANNPVNFFIGGSGATQCGFFTQEKAKGTQVRNGQSIQCNGAACASGVTLPYDMSVLVPRPSTGNPIDEIDATNVCQNSAGVAAFAFANVFLTPGEFFLDRPTNTCVVASADAPVTLVWSASGAAEKYNVFRVIDEDRNGKVDQNEIESAIDRGDYNLNLANPLSPKDAQCDTDASCTWTDESAKKNVPYFYIVRGRNVNGVTFSDTLVANTLADYKPKAYTPTCNQPPVAVAGVSAEAQGTTPNPGRTYAPSIRVKKGQPYTLYFASVHGTAQGPSNTSYDPNDRETPPDPDKGIFNGGECQWNSNLSSTINPITGQPDFEGSIDDRKPITTQANWPYDCVVTRDHTFTDAGGIYEAFRLKDKPGALSTPVQQVTITAVAAPLITSFTATPNQINQDQAFTLAWASTGAASCSSTDADFNTAIAGQTSGSAPISNLHTSPKDYVLNCASADTDLYPTPATQTVTVTINQCVATLTPSRTSVPTPGDPITLSWSATNATSCSLNHTSPATNMCSASAACATGGTTGNIAITSARTFTLSCTGDAGPCTATTPTISVANQAPTAIAGASTNISLPRTYSNTITVTQNVPADIFLSAGPTIDGAAGSADSDGSLARCDWNTDFGRAPPITFEQNDVITSGVSDCDRTVSARTFTDSPTVVGTPNIYPLLRVTDNEGATADATLRVNILPQLAVSLTANPVSGDAPFAPTLRADITTYTGAASDAGNFSIWWDCTNTSSEIGVVSNPNACGLLPSDPTPGDRICAKNANGAKCDGVPLQGQEFLTTVVDPAYTARATAYTPKVIVERGSARSAEARASATALIPAPTVSCAVAPSSAITGANITWTATPGGGSGNYSFSWAGDVPLQGRTGLAPVVSYTSAGNKNGTVTVTDTVTNLTRTGSCGPTVISLPPNGAPVAVAGISKDTSSTRSYTSSVDVKFGIATPLYFSAFIGTKASPTAGQISTDPDGWTSPEGVSNGGHCDWNVELRQQAPPVYPDSHITSPASPTACEASRSNPVSTPYTFNDAPQNDAQLSRALTYNILQITDNRATVSNDGQASVNVHYAPTASLTANGGATATVNSGAPVVIAWSSTHATSCTGTGFSTGATSPASGTVTVNPTADTDYSVSCNGSPLWGAATASAGVTMSFNFTLAASGNITVTQGDTTQNSATITVTKTNGAAVPVSFSASGLPAGASAVFTPETCTPSTGSPAICTTVMSITTTKGAGATPVGAYPISVTGSSASFTSPATTLTLTVNSRISATIFSTPVTGFAPLDIKLTAETSDYTGAPIDSLTYTFWWDCAKPGTDVSALSGATTTPGGCGDPSDIAIGIVFPGEPGATKDTPVHLYPTPATYTGKVVVQRGAAKAEARAQIVVQDPGGAPVAKVKISANPNADREYFDAITVKKGEPTHIFLAADDRTGAGSFDPDGWTAANGVSATGKCEWNSALAQTLPVPFAATISSPLSASACNIDIGIKTFNDAPGTYTYDVLRITDNKNLPSNIARIKITVSPEPVNAAPTAAVKASTDTNATRQYFDEITVQRNAATPIYLAADDGTGNGSFDPDGWTSANGVSGSGKCQWNSALSTDLPVPYATNIAAPASAAECNTFIGTKTFSNPVGQYVFDVLRITDNKGLKSNIARIKINVAETIIVNHAPSAAVRISTNPNADRTYADSVTVQRNVATPLYLAADDGTGAPNVSFDSDGWTAENGVAGSGKCEWNSALSQALPVPYATVFNRPSNPAECNVFIGDKTFSDAPGIYVYDVLRITDNKGLKSNIARTRIKVEETIVVNHPPVAAAKVSTDLNFDRQYFDSVAVIRGVATPIYLAADDGTSEKSYDPDGWTSANGVAGSGKCEWNSALSQALPVPFGKQFVAPGSAAQCNTSLGNITFNDAPGTYTYGVLRITDNKGLASNVATIQIVISNAPPGPSNGRPIARAQVSTDPNFGRTYFDSVTVQRGVATPIYGSAALSSDPDGWDALQRGVSNGGKCEWNRDLSQDDPVSFEAPAIQNPDAPADCNALLGTFTFNDAPGTYTYGALRITDAGGLKSVVAPITITVSTQPPGPGNNAPIARARISKNRNFNRIYGNTLTVVRGELTPIYVAADDGSGTSTVSFDPDGWTSANGVSAGGKCEWNRDLSQDDPVSFEAPAVVSPQGASDCNVYLGDFTFNDEPGEYVYGMLRVTDNKGLKSNVAPIMITVAATHAPVAVVGISKDQSFDRVYQPIIEVPQGVATPIFIAAIEGTLQAPTRQSLDPDGWANNANGVSNGGKCEWNRNLILAEPEFVNPPTSNPLTPADCRVSLGNRTFNNSPGTYAFGVLKITDKSGLASNIAVIRIRVGLPELTVVPPQVATGALVEGGSVTFSDIVRNSGTITAEGTIANRFQVDIDNDGTINLTLGNPPVQNLTTGAHVGVNSNIWNNLPLGTHRIIFSTNTDGLIIESNSANNTAQTIVTVSSQQLSVGLSANPSSATTTLPTIITATVPGQAAAPINYSFWWNCSDPTNNVSVAASSCGALPLPIPGECVSNAVGAKCDGIAALSESVTHTYGQPGTFMPKVIVERGTQSPAESRTQVTVTTNPTGGPLTVSCSVSPTAARAGDIVTWSAFPQGGSGPYAFTWGGDAPLADKTGNPVNVNYGSIGAKRGSIVVTSGPETALRDCGTVNVLPGITSFTTASSTLTPGATTTLSWSTVGFTSCTLDKGGGPQTVPVSCTVESCPAGVNQVAPTQSTTYTLVCTAPSGSSDTKNLIIRVLSQPASREIVPE